MGVNIRDVAAMAGVSVTTVSHVLNKQGRVAPETRKRVESVAAQLGYRANIHAQQLVTRRSRTLAIQVSRLAMASKSTALVPNSEYFLEVLNGAAAAADELGYALILTPPAVSAETIEAFGIDGAIIVDPLGDEPLFHSMGDRSPRLVTTGRPGDGTAHPFTVDNDHRAAAVAMLDHLVEQGYGFPAVVVTDTSRSYVRDLITGYEEWALSRSSPRVVFEPEETEQLSAGAVAVRDLMQLNPRPDAIYAGSEDLAIEIFHEAFRQGLRIPEDLALCSAVDSYTLQLTSPTVTGMYLYPRDVGRRAAELVIELVEAGGELADRSVVVPTRLAMRDSTRRL